MADLPVIYTAGPVAASERDLLYIAFALMMIVIIPVWIMAVWFPWKYRASNTSAEYRPHWDFSPAIEAAVWLVPALIVLAIGSMVWIYTHSLDPYKPLPGGKPLTVQAIAMDWKWVFVYPDQNIATVNELVVPEKRPVTIDITSDTVMNSLYLPGLAGQIYAMAGMETKLNFQVDHKVTTIGRNTNFSGGKFPDQKFAVKAVDEADFEQWVAKVRETNTPLDMASYQTLSSTRDTAPVTLYSSVVPKLFDKVIEKYMGTSDMNMNAEDSAGESSSNDSAKAASQTKSGD